MPLLVEFSSPSPSMELRLLSKRWFPIKAGGGKNTKTTKRHAYHEGGGYACCKNGFADEEVG
jgi:hypothetical protein